jgi:hypothetical protein
MGAALFAHVVSYMSVSYFDQSIVNWYMLLAMIATATDQFVRTQPREHAQVEQFETDAEVHYESRLGFRRYEGDWFGRQRARGGTVRLLFQGTMVLFW